MEDRRGKCTENEANWFTFPGIRCCPSVKDTLERRVPRTQKSNVEIERMEIIKAGGEPVSLYYLT